MALLYTPVIETGGLLGFIAHAYGWGYFVETLAGGQQAVMHGGENAGWIAQFYPLSVDMLPAVTPWLTAALAVWAAILPGLFDFTQGKPTGQRSLERPNTGPRWLLRTCRSNILWTMVWFGLVWFGLVYRDKVLW